MKNLSRRTMIVMLGLLFVFSALLAPQPAKAMSAWINCQDARVFYTPSWSGVRIGTVYINDLVYADQVTNGFRRIYFHAGGYWGWVTNGCVTLF